MRVHEKEHTQELIGTLLLICTAICLWNGLNIGNALSKAVKTELCSEIVHPYFKSLQIGLL